MLRVRAQHPLKSGRRLPLKSSTPTQQTNKQITKHNFVAFLEHYKLAQLEVYQAEVFAGIMLFNNAARARSTPAEIVSAAAIEIKCAETADEQADH